MAKFYISFGQSHTHRINNVTCDRDSIYEIEAHNRENAHSLAFELFDKKWASIYDRVQMFGLDVGDEGAAIRHFPRGVIN